MLLKAYKTLSNGKLTEAMETLLKSLNRQLLFGKGVQSTPYLIDLVGEIEFLRCQKELMSLKLISSKLRYNFAQCEVNTETLEDLGYDIEDYKFQAKVLKYTMTPDSDTSCNSSGYRDNFVKHHNQVFKLDVDMLIKYEDEIYSNIVQKMMEERIRIMKKAKKEISSDFFFELENEYEGVIREVLVTYISSPHGTYCLNGCNLDYRKRAIAKGLSKILNPISFKVGRSLVKLIDSETKVLTTTSKELDNVYLFIAEEVGESSIGHDIEWKIEEGKRCYKNKISSNDLHVKIWMERIYTQLDTLYSIGCVTWSTPIEIDYSMSMAVVIGLGTGDVRLMKETNVLYNSSKELFDPWYIKGVQRKVAKSLTAQFYGSTESLVSLNKGNTLEDGELRTLKKASRKGKFSVILALGKLMQLGSNINTPSYTVNMNDEIYDVEVKKTKTNGAVRTDYFTFVDGVDDLATFFNHVPTKEKDYDRNRLSFLTGYAHNRDSYLLEGCLPDCFALPIHDAVVTSPWGATESRERARLRMISMYNNRKESLMAYLKSIGVINKDNTFSSSIAMELFEEFKATVKEYKGNPFDDFSGHAMK